MMCADVPRVVMDKFEALYIINKSSKKYRNIGGDRNRDRKTALYRLKHEMIDRWIDEFDIVEIHRIDDNNLLYFEKGDYGYHAPIDKFDTADVDISEVKEITNFYSSPVNSSDSTERKALEYIKSDIGLNVNDYLPKGHESNAKWGLLY